MIAATEYDQYLHRLPDGTENPYGTPFLDYHYPADFSGRLNIIYGRQANGGEMFGALLPYQKQSYYEDHPALKLYTAENGDYHVDLLYGFEVKAGDWREWAFMYEVNLSSLLGYGEVNSTFESDVKYSDADRFLVLSAGGSNFDGKRYVVIGVLR